MSTEQPERLWSMDRAQQIQMQRLYLMVLNAKKDWVQKSLEGHKDGIIQFLTTAYAASLAINFAGSPLPAHKAQLVFEAAMED